MPYALLFFNNSTKRVDFKTFDTSEALAAATQQIDSSAIKIYSIPEDKYEEAQKKVTLANQRNLSPNRLNAASNVLKDLGAKEFLIPPSNQSVSTPRQPAALTGSQLPDGGPPANNAMEDDPNEDEQEQLQPPAVSPEKPGIDVAEQNVGDKRKIHLDPEKQTGLKKPKLRRHFQTSHATVGQTLNQGMTSGKTQIPPGDYEFKIEDNKIILIEEKETGSYHIDAENQKIFLEIVRDIHEKFFTDSFDFSLSDSENLPVFSLKQGEEKKMELCLDVIDGMVKDRMQKNHPTNQPLQPDQQEEEPKIPIGRYRLAILTDSNQESSKQIVFEKVEPLEDSKEDIYEITAENQVKFSKMITSTAAKLDANFRFSQLDSSNRPFIFTPKAGIQGKVESYLRVIKKDIKGFISAQELAQTLQADAPLPYVPDDGRTVAVTGEPLRDRVSSKQLKECKILAERLGALIPGARGTPRNIGMIMYEDTTNNKRLLIAISGTFERGLEQLKEQHKKPFFTEGLIDSMNKEMVDRIKAELHLVSIDLVCGVNLDGVDTANAVSLEELLQDKKEFGTAIKAGINEPRGSWDEEGYRYYGSYPDFYKHNPDGDPSAGDRYFCAEPKLADALVKLKRDGQVKRVIGEIHIEVKENVSKVHNSCDGCRLRCKRLQEELEPRPNSPTQVRPF